MDVALAVIRYILFVFWFLLIARLIVEVVRSFAREWRPTGATVVVLETIFTATDPPVKAVRKVLPPIPLGPVRLDLSLTVVLLAVLIAMALIP